MGRVVAFVFVAPANIAIAWGAYLGSKWVASLLVQSQVDQTVMGLLAVVALYTVGWAIAAGGD